MLFLLKENVPALPEYWRRCVIGPSGLFHRSSRGLRGYLGVCSGSCLFRFRFRKWQSPGSRFRFPPLRPTGGRSRDSRNCRWSSTQIGVYADSTKTRDKDGNIAKKRAEYIKSLFVENGIDAKRISAERLRKELANAMINENDAQKNRDCIVAFRFKK